MTDPRGYSFLSYRRSRSDDAGQLVAAQKELGIPTWQDVENLDEQPTEDELRSVLARQEIASGLLWITPEIAGSQMIRQLSLCEQRSA